MRLRDAQGTGFPLGKQGLRSPLTGTGSGASSLGLLEKSVTALQ